MDRPEANFTWRLEPDGADTVLHVRGELDIGTVPRLGLQLDELVRQEGGGSVTIDASELTFIDSTGLHVLINAQRRLTRQRRALKVINPPDSVRRAIELSRLSETLGLN